MQQVGPDQTILYPFLCVCKEKNNCVFLCSIRAPCGSAPGSGHGLLDLWSFHPGGSRLPLSHRTTNVTSVSQFFVTDVYGDGDASPTGVGFSTATAAFSMETCKDAPLGAMLRGVRCSLDAQSSWLRVWSYFCPKLVAQAGSSAWGVCAGLVCPFLAQAADVWHFFPWVL